ncbi:MAG: efflux RND transporter permease subunit, partial [Aureliella sp.]
MGKAGRAETATDPAPLDMVETVINLRPHEFWPKRELRYDDAIGQTKRIAEAASIPDDATINNVTMLALEQFDATMRSIVLQEQILHEQQLAPKLVDAAIARTLELLRGNGFTSDLATITVPINGEKQLGEQLVQSPNISTGKRITAAVRQYLIDNKAANADVDATLVKSNAITTTIGGIAELLGTERASFDDLVLEHVIEEREKQIAKFVKELNWRLIDSAASLYTNLVVDNLRTSLPDAEIALSNASAQRLKDEFAANLLLWQKDKSGLLNELDSVVRMPGWGNIWTQPIINRIDMLATGVNTMLGVRVFGDDINKISEKCEQIAAVLKRLRGAVDVSADQVVGEGYLEIDIDRERAARFGINIGDIQDVIETALGGRVITMTVEGRERFPVRIRYARAFREDELSVKNLLVTAASGNDTMQPVSTTATQSKSTGSPTAPMQIPLSQVADIRIVSGPSMIRSENGLLRSYVRLNVRDRDVVGFVEEARQAVASEVAMPEGMYIEWTGQFEHEVRARRTLSIIVPAVVLTIFVLLFVVYHDLADTLIVMCLTVPGAVFGGVLFQYLFGYNFSVAVWVGFIACFG